MKKWLAILLALALMASLSACGCQKEPTAENPTETTAPTEPAAVALSGSMTQNVEKIMEANPTGFMGAARPLDLTDTSEDGLWALKNDTGLSSAEKITDGAVYEPMNGSQAFSLVLVRVANSADPKAVAREMVDNINTRKWICVEADQKMAAGYGDVVLLIMLDSQLGKTAQSYVDAFEKLCGGKLDFTL